MPSANKQKKREEYLMKQMQRMAERAAKPKIERQWVQIKEVPEHVESEGARLALQYLIAKTDRVEMMRFPKDQSQYRAYLDDGAYKGCFVFAWTENGLTPFKVYEKLQQTGWPGYSMGWVKRAAIEEMQRELSKETL